MISKSQTATEYLVILGVVAVIAVITVGTLSDVISLGGGLNEKQIRLELAVQSVGIADYAVSDYETVLTLKNNEDSLMRVDSIAINGEKCLFFYTDEIRLSPGATKNVRCMNVYTITDEDVAYSIEINYTDMKTDSSYSQFDSDLVLVGDVLQTYYSVVSSNIYWNTSISGCYDNTTSPIPICTCADLNKTRNDLGSNFTLQNSLDFNRCKEEFGIDFTVTNGLGGWRPICTQSDACQFSGIIDGNHNIINNLYINSTEYYAGIVGLASNYGATFKNIGLINVNVTCTQESTGALAGDAYGATATDVFVTGEVIGSADYIGGLIGDGMRVVVSNSYSHAKVTGLGTADEVGGLIGRGYRGTISNTYATGDISGRNQVGGLYGHGDRGTVENSFSTGFVSGSSMVGGLIGRMGIATASNVYATGNVSGSSYVGGLFGYSYATTIQSCYALGKVVSGSLDVGGLTGYNDLGEIYDSFAFAPVVSSGTRIGGLVGGTDYALPDVVNRSYWINSSNGGAATNCVTGTSAFDSDCLEVSSLADVPLYTN